MYSQSTVETSIFIPNFHCKLFKGKIFHFFMIVTWFGFFYFKAILRNSEIIEEFCKLMISPYFSRHRYSSKNFVKYLCEACAKMEFNILHLETVVESFLQ